MSRSPPFLGSGTLTCCDFWEETECELSHFFKRLRSVLVEDVNFRDLFIGGLLPGRESSLPLEAEFCSLGCWLC